MTNPSYKRIKDENVLFFLFVFCFLENNEIYEGTLEGLNCVHTIGCSQ